DRTTAWCSTRLVARERARRLGRRVVHPVAHEGRGLEGKGHALALRGPRHLDGERAGELDLDRVLAVDGLRRLAPDERATRSQGEVDLRAVELPLRERE